MAPFANLSPQHGIDSPYSNESKPGPTFKAGQAYLFLGDNNVFLSAINYGGIPGNTGNSSDKGATTY